MSLLLFHRIAAQRGDGLLPEFVALFERHAAAREDRRGDVEPAPHPSPDLAPAEPPIPENVLQFPSAERDDAPLIGEAAE